MLVKDFYDERPLQNSENAVIPVKTGIQNTLNLLDAAPQVKIPYQVRDDKKCNQSTFANVSTLKKTLWQQECYLRPYCPVGAYFRPCNIIKAGHMDVKDHASLPHDGLLRDAPAPSQ